MASEAGIISFRVPADEYEQIQRAAQAAGESVSAYVRKAIALRLTGADREPEPPMAKGASYVEYSSGRDVVTAFTTTPRVYVFEPRVRVKGRSSS